MSKSGHFLFGVLFTCLSPFFIKGQDLDPRAYVRVPVKSNAIIAGFSYMSGSIVTDPSLPVKDIKATVQVPSLGYLRSFNLFGLTAQALVALPYTWAQVSGKVAEQQNSITRSGLADMRLRLSVLLIGGAAADMEEIKKAPRKTILGISVNINAPSGQFFPDKLINIGMNRWAFRPELALSQPVGKRWMIDLYSGIWLFTDNTSFYPGNSTRSQDPMLSFQGHLSYNIRPFLWVALNATYYVGGQSRVNSIYSDDRQSNARVGVTTAIPFSKRSAIKLSASTGAIVRIGQNFTTYSFGYQYAWIGKSKSKTAAIPE